MRRRLPTAIVSLGAVAASLSIATAQPAATAPVTLTPREQSLLARGEISGTRHVAGTVVAVAPGFGLGHVIQGRWKQRGWIFTFGQMVTFGMAAVAASESDLDQSVVTALAIAGWGGYLGLRVWEVADAVTGPGRHNRRVRALRLKAGQPTASGTAQPFVAPCRQSGVLAGIVVRF